MLPRRTGRDGEIGKPVLGDRAALPAVCTPGARVLRVLDQHDRDKCGRRDDRGQRRLRARVDGIDGGEPL